MYIGSCSEGGGLLGKAERRKNMYRIGEFSRITSLTVKALRYYDEEGIPVSYTHLTLPTTSRV